jgi:hypothetical protein
MANEDVRQVFACSVLFVPEVSIGTAINMFCTYGCRYRFSGEQMPKTDKLSITVIGEEQYH